MYVKLLPNRFLSPSRGDYEGDDEVKTPTRRSSAAAASSSHSTPESGKDQSKNGSKIDGTPHKSVADAKDSGIKNSGAKEEEVQGSWLSRSIGWATGSNTNPAEVNPNPNTIPNTIPTH